METALDAELLIIKNVTQMDKKNIVISEKCYNGDDNNISPIIPEFKLERKGVIKYQLMRGHGLNGMYADSFYAKSFDYDHEKGIVTVVGFNDVVTYYMANNIVSWTTVDIYSVNTYYDSCYSSSDKRKNLKRREFAVPCGWVPTKVSEEYDYDLKVTLI